MKSLLFPFAKKYHLASRAWHRFAVVLYCTIIAGSLYGIFALTQFPELNSQSACYQTYIEANPRIDQQTLMADCGVLAPDTGLNIVMAVIGTIIVSYLLQILYYKIILFVAFGKKDFSDESISEANSFLDS